MVTTLGMASRAISSYVIDGGDGDGGSDCRCGDGGVVGHNISSIDDTQPGTMMGAAAALIMNVFINNDCLLLQRCSVYYY